MALFSSSRAAKGGFALGLTMMVSVEAFLPSAGPALVHSGMPLRATRLGTSPSSFAPSGLAARPLTQKETREQNAAASLKMASTRASAIGMVGTSALKLEPLGILAGITAVAVAWAAYLLNRPSREYKDGENTVGNEYDAWTEEGLLEYYWGEHIHLGYYDKDDIKAQANPFKSAKVFKDTKYRFIEEMYKWSGVEQNKGKPLKVLDVGCGIGGTSRYLANKLGPETSVTGITLSPKQVERATSLAKERGLDNANFQVMNALDMEFEDNTFDLVWGCESGEHMPDKQKYVDEMTRVCKPGGTVVIATWCQREETPETPITPDEQDKLDFLYKEWAHPYFISIEEYERNMAKTGKLQKIKGENWVKETIAAWRHSIWVGVWDPWIVIWKGFTSKLGPLIWWKTIREIVTLERMHKAFDCGLMTYGMIKAQKAEA